MRVLQVRNVQEALPRAVKLLFETGVQRDSRNGPVLFGGSLTTVYEKPLEKVVFWDERDANPFFHLYESLWMLCGRNDFAPLVRYVKQAGEYTDDGVTLHGAYGFRWRNWFGDVHDGPDDQLQTIIEILKRDPNDRRCVLQMWDADTDLDRQGKDVPCNVIATFQRGIHGELNLVVFCRSNDIVWGAYGANAVQFGTLLEYMAMWIGCHIGTYEQVSVNWHGYLKTMEQVKNLRPDHAGFVRDPYSVHAERGVFALNMADDDTPAQVDTNIKWLVHEADTGFTAEVIIPAHQMWTRMVYTVLRAHHAYKTSSPETRFGNALHILESYPHQQVDWIVAAKQWLNRRMMKALHEGRLSHP